MYLCTEEIRRPEKKKEKRRRQGEVERAQGTTASVRAVLLSSWLGGDSGVKNSNLWPSTKSENQFLVEFTHPLPIYHLHTHLLQCLLKEQFCFTETIKEGRTTAI